jgi:hypothetical protein
MGEKSMKERVEEIPTTINFSITKCPEKVFKRFIEFCKQETNDNYSFGLKLLLDAREGNIKEALLYEQYIELKARLGDVEVKLEKFLVEIQGTPKKKLPKTMGSANKKKEEKKK